MIKFENTKVYGWEAAIRGMRNPMNSWAKSDTKYYDACYEELCPGVSYLDNSKVVALDPPKIGPNDLALMKKLRNAGTDHRKFMRYIQVAVDITAPLFWWAEFDTYKVGTVRNSCSFMHKGTSKQFAIDDFCFEDERVYEVLRDYNVKQYKLTYPYDTEEFKVWCDPYYNRKYRVYRNGKVIREQFEYTDEMGRKRIFEESEANIYQNVSGYYIVKFSGRNAGSLLLHRLIALVWIPNDDKNKIQVNHINGNKGDNSIENLEWVTSEDNIRKAWDAGLYNNNVSLHRRYISWKYSANRVPAFKRVEFMHDCRLGLSCSQLAEKYRITSNQANNARYLMSHSVNESLFQQCYIWEEIIGQLNELRYLYIETKDDRYFKALRALLPQGYMQRSTILLNYEVLANMAKKGSRRDHRLDEWRVGFMDWIKELPYSELIFGEETSNEQSREKEEG